MDANVDRTGSALSQLRQQRRQVLEEMGSIGSMQRGTLSEQYLRVQTKAEPQPVLRGPYYVLSCNG